MRNSLLNITGLSGFAILGVGLWWFSPPLALVVVGGLMLVISVYSILRRAG